MKAGELWLARDIPPTLACPRASCVLSVTVILFFPPKIPPVVYNFFQGSSSMNLRNVNFVNQQGQNISPSFRWGEGADDLSVPLQCEEQEPPNPLLCLV